MKRPAAFALLLLLLCFPFKSEAGFTFREDVKSVKIPVEIINNIVLIPVRINGSFELNFIFDTGVRTTILTEPLLSNFLSLDSLQKVKVRGLGEGDAIEAILARNVSMTLPGVLGKGINLIVLPQGIISYSEMFGKPVFGIIGYEIFGQFVVEIDYQNKFVRLYDPFSFKLKGKWKRNELPIEVRKGKPYVNAKLIDHLGGEIESKWLIDTGASQAVALFDKNLEVPDQTVETFLGKGLSGDVYGRLGRVQGFQLGKFTFKDVIAGYPEVGSLNILHGKKSVWYGNLGAEIISRFNVIFDYPRRRLYFKKNNKYRKPFTYNVSGIEVLAKGHTYENFFISYVRPNSPAAEAGIQIDDEIVALNGISISGLDIGDMYLNLNKKIGKKISVKIRRGESTFKKRFSLISEL